MANSKTNPAGKGPYITRVFATDNAQAVLIPRELQFERLDIEYDIERVGDEIRIRPARRRLTGVATMFASFPEDFMVERGTGDESKQD